MPAGFPRLAPPQQTLILLQRNLLLLSRSPKQKTNSLQTCMRKQPMLLPLLQWPLWLLLLVAQQRQQVQQRRLLCPKLQMVWQQWNRRQQWRQLQPQRSKQ